MIDGMTWTLTIRTGSLGAHVSTDTLTGSG
jgi:hypothetical protein